MSIVSSSCRIDWRPSSRLCFALLALGVLGAACVLGSGLPGWSRALLAPAALAYGAWLARREWRRDPCALEFDADGAVLMRPGAPAEAMAAPSLRLRGNLASLAWRDPRGRRRSLLWWADNLPAASRRQLLLRAGGRSLA